MLHLDQVHIWCQGHTKVKVIPRWNCKCLIFYQQAGGGPSTERHSCLDLDLHYCTGTTAEAENSLLYSSCSSYFITGPKHSYENPWILQCSWWHDKKTVSVENNRLFLEWQKWEVLDSPLTWIFTSRACSRGNVFIMSVYLCVCLCVSVCLFGLQLLNELT